MGDICIDYCESTDCKNCSYRKASKEDKEKAYEHLIKTFMCPLRCNAIEMDDECLYLMNKNYYKGYNDGIQDSLANKTLEKIAKLFEEEFVYYDSWALDKWYEIKGILEKEYWKD